MPVVEPRPLQEAERLDTLSRQLAALRTGGFAVQEICPLPEPRMDAARAHSSQLRRQMIASQEELDWRCYRLYGLLSADEVGIDLEWPAPIEVALGERAFEIVLARRMSSPWTRTNHLV